MARWLETIYEPKSQLNPFNAYQLNAGSNDFDKEKTGRVAGAELKILSTIFDHLRGGKLQQVQSFLHENLCQDKHLYLLGNLPFFDNVSYS